MTEVVNSFVVGHWAAARRMMDRHVSKHTRNVVSVESEEADKQPKKVYEHLLSTFSKEEDLILDIGSGNGKKKNCFCCVATTIHHWKLSIECPFFDLASNTGK